jgi:hypothetical protein
MTSNHQFAFGMFVGALLLGAGWSLGGAAQRVVPANESPQAGSVQQVIQTRRLEIIDQTGTVLLALAADEHGGSLSVRDRLGRTALQAQVNEVGGSLQLHEPARNAPSAALQTLAGGAEFALLNADGHKVVRAATGSEAARFSLADARGNPAVVLDHTSQGCGRLRTLRPDGTIVAELKHDAARGGLIETHAADGHRLIALTSTVGGHGRLDTFGPAGDAPLVSLTSTGEHEGQIYTFNDAGRMLAAIASRSAGPTLRLFNQFGEAVVTIQSTEDGNGEIGVLNRDGAGRYITP